MVNDSRVVFPDENRNAPESKKVLQRPDGWDWDMDSHAKRFPTEFIDATQTFLLCYDRMRKRYMVSPENKRRRSAKPRASPADSNACIAEASPGARQGQGRGEPDVRASQASRGLALCGG